MRVSWGIAVVIAGWTVLEGQARGRPLDLGPVGPFPEQVLRARLGVGWKYAEVPRFSASSRDLLAAVLDAAWRPLDRVDLGVSYSGGASWTAVGDSVAEPGRVALHTGVDLAPAGAAPLVLQAGWRASVPVEPRAPHTADSGEADVDLLLSVGRRAERWHLLALGGLGIAGNPLLDGAQDDLPLLRLAAGWSAAGVDLDASLGGFLRTSRNPGRTSLLLSAERQGRLLVGAEVGVGLTPAAAALQVSAWTGLSWACRRACGD